MTTFAHYPIAQVRPHPKNVRRTATASPEMVESIRSAGILEPVILGPEVVADDGETVRYLIAGNVRHDGAVKAELSTLPAVLRDDLATEAQQIEAMLVENLHRTDLTAVEEAEGYEQLQLFGMDEAAIAAATGRSKATVKSRLRLNDLPSKAREQLHAGEATLADAESLLEFADDHEVMASLEAALGTSDFRWRVQSARDTRIRSARNAEAVAEFKDIGAVEAEGDGWKNLTGFWTSDLQKHEPHLAAGCLGYLEPDPASYASPRLVCLQPDTHTAQEEETRGTVNGGGGSVYRPDPEWERQREENRAAAQARAAASKVRLDHLNEVFCALLGVNKKGSADLAAAVKAFLPFQINNMMIEELINAELLDHAFGLDTDVTSGSSWEDQRNARADHAMHLATEGTTGDLLAALASLLAALAETSLSAIAERGVYDDAEAERTLSSIAWDWLASTGYELSTADEQVRSLALSEPDEDDA